MMIEKTILMNLIIAVLENPERELYFDELRYLFKEYEAALIVEKYKEDSNDGKL